MVSDQRRDDTRDDVAKSLSNDGEGARGVAGTVDGQSHVGTWRGDTPLSSRLLLLRRC